MTRPHTTHHESCGCCEAERDALKAQVDRMREEATRALDAIAGANSLAAYDALKRALAERAPEVER